MTTLNFQNARILLKGENDTQVIADTKITNHDVSKDWIWVDTDLFNIPENSKLNALIVSTEGFHEVLCMSHKKENDGSGQRLSIYKHLTGNEQRQESRYSMSHDGSLIVLTGKQDVINRQINIRITDISANGIGLLLQESAELRINDKIEVFFVANGWSMRASGKVTYVFGPRIGARLSNIEKNHIVKDNDRFSKDLKDKIDKAFEHLFISAHYINLQKETFMEVFCMSHIRHVISGEKRAQIAINSVVDAAVIPEEKDAVIAFCDLSTLSKRIRNRSKLSLEFDGNFLGTCRFTFIPVDYDEHDNLHGVLLVAQKIDEELLKLRQNDLTSLVDEQQSNQQDQQE